MTVLALDLSSTATGVADDGGTRTWKPKGDLHTRARQMAAWVDDMVQADRPDRVLVEAIGTRHVQTAIAIATVHALVLDALHHHELVPLAVSPALLKKWATGKGNVDKTAMVTSAMKAGWNAPDDATDDQADAWWLWTIGRALLGQWDVPQTVYRTDVINTLGEQ